MERLTIDEIIAHCKRIVRKKEEALNGKDFFETEPMGHYPMKEYWEHRQVAEYLEELKEYRKAEEQGLLLRLPCEVGDTIYANLPFGNARKTYEREVEGFRTLDGTWVIETESYDYPLSYIGKTVFLTREEAEAALAEKGGAE